MFHLSRRLDHPAPPFPQPDTFVAPPPGFPPPQPMPVPEIPPPLPPRSPPPHMPEPRVPAPPESVSEPSGSSSTGSYFLDRFEDLLDNLRRGQTIAPTPRPAPGTRPSVLQELDNLISGRLESSHVTPPEPFRGLRFVPGLRPRESVESLLQTRPATEPPPTQFPDLGPPRPSGPARRRAQPRRGPRVPQQPQPQPQQPPQQQRPQAHTSSHRHHRRRPLCHHLLFLRRQSLSDNLQEDLLQGLL